jgi:hypothetical protein
VGAPGGSVRISWLIPQYKIHTEHPSLNLLRSVGCDLNIRREWCISRLVSMYSQCASLSVAASALYDARISRIESLV